MNEKRDNNIVTNTSLSGSNGSLRKEFLISSQNIEVNNSHNQINNNSKNYYDSKVPLSPNNHAVGNQGFEHRKTEEMREM